MRLTATLALGVLLAPGCGYGLVGRGGGFDPSIRKIAVPLFRDAAVCGRLDEKVTQKVIEELLKRGKVDVVQTAEGADAVVDGEIASCQTQPVGFSGDQKGTQATRYSITVVARVRYFKPGEPQPLWQSDSFTFRDEYDVGSDPGTFFDREDQGIERLSQAFARSLVAAMLEAF